MMHRPQILDIAWKGQLKSLRKKFLMLRALRVGERSINFSIRSKIFVLISLKRFYFD